MRKFEGLVSIKDEYIIAGKRSEFTKEEFLKKAKGEFEFDNKVGKLEIQDHTLQEKYGRILNHKCSGRHYNIEDDDVRGNFPIYILRYIKE